MGRRRAARRREAARCPGLRRAAVALARRGAPPNCCALPRLNSPKVAPSKRFKSANAGDALSRQAAAAAAAAARRAAAGSAAARGAGGCALARTVTTRARHDTALCIAAAARASMRDVALLGF